MRLTRPLLWCVCGLLALASAGAASTFYAGTGNTDGGRFIQIDPTTGAGTLIGSTGFSAISGLAISSDGTIYATTGGSGNPSSLITIDPTTGVGTSIGSLSDGYDGLAISPGGTMFANRWNSSNGELWMIDPTTAAESKIADISGCTGNNHVPGLDFSSGGTLYGSRGGSSGHVENLVTLDTGTGACTPIGSGSSNNVTGVAFDPDTGILYGVTGGGSGLLITIDPTTGAETTVGPIGFGSVSSLVIISAAVPALPAGWGALLAGLILAIGVAVLASASDIV